MESNYQTADKSCHRTTSLGGLPQVDRQSRRGVILPLVAVLLPTLLILLGFAVDLTYMQLVRTELRAAVDMSSKAAASTLARTEDTTLARTAALDVARQNRIAGVQLDLQPTDIVFGRATQQFNGSFAFSPGLSPFNAVRVTGSRTSGSTNGSVPLFFNRLYSSASFEPQVSATTSFNLVDICLVLDRSTSMKLDVPEVGPGMLTSDPRFCVPPQSTSRWVALAGAVSIFTDILSNTGGNAKVAVVTFSSDFSSPCGNFNPESSVDVGLTSNMSSIMAAMNARSTSVWNGNTNIDAGIRQAEQVLSSSTGARSLADKVMIVLTDGVFTGDDPVEDAEDASDNGNATVHTITFSDNANQADMIRVANAGGGEHFHAPDEASLRSAFEQLAGSISKLVE